MPQPNPVQVRPADIDRPREVEAVMTLLNPYAADPMGSGEPLLEDTLNRLVPALRQVRDIWCCWPLPGSGPLDDFSLDPAVRIASHDRAGLEQLLRYCAPLFRPGSTRQITAPRSP